MGAKIAFLAIAVLAPFGYVGATADAACSPGHRGEADCPDYTAPATTAVPGPSIDGSTFVVGVPRQRSLAELFRPTGS
jgi:hypothetical protein